MYSTRYLIQILMITEMSRQFLKKYSNIKFHENPSSRSRVFPCGQTDMTKLIVVFLNLANAPKILWYRAPVGLLGRTNWSYELVSADTHQILLQNSPKLGTYWC